MTPAFQLFIPFYLFLPTYGAGLLDNYLRESYDEQNLARNIFVRISRRSWKIFGPSSETEEVLDEYHWDVETAYEAMTSSGWDYDVTSIDDVEELFKSEDYDKTLDTIAIIHPVIASDDASFVKTTAIALAMRNLHKNYNIFAIFMPEKNWVVQLSVIQLMAGNVPRFEPISKAMSRFLVKGIKSKHLKPEQIHLLGWSYSGQLVGYMGRYIEQKYGTKIASITALEPVANLMNHDYIHVSEMDARIVHVYHSNSYLTGTRERIGTADFVFNGGMILPECRDMRLANLCSHSRIMQRFWYMILYPSKFLWRSCPTWNSLINCYCEKERTQTIHWPIKPDSQAEGTYYLRTLDTKPYGLGKWGVSCSSERLLQREFIKMNL